LRHLIICERACAAREKGDEVETFFNILAGKSIRADDESKRARAQSTSMKERRGKKKQDETQSKFEKREESARASKYL